MSWRDLAAQLGPALDALGPDDALEAVGALAALQARAFRSALRAEQYRLLTVDEAAELAAVPNRRIRSWARGKAWARRPSKRTLRIDAAAFRAWLTTRDVHNERQPSLASMRGAGTRA